MGSRNLHARLTDEARDGWDDFCAKHGVSVTAMAEAIGQWFALDPEPSTNVLEMARAIDVERRRR